MPIFRHFLDATNMKVPKIKDFLKKFQKKEGFLKALANILIVDVKILHILKTFRR
jgi:hypothetical protein